MGCVGKLVAFFFERPSPESQDIRGTNHPDGFARLGGIRAHVLLDDDHVFGVTHEHRARDFVHGVTRTDT